MPLLGGGNDLFTLAPDLAIRYFALITIALAGLSISSETRRDDSPPSITTIALVVLMLFWGAALALRPSGPRAALESQGIFCAALLYALFASKPLDGSEMRAWVIGLVAGTLVTTAYGQYQYWLMFPRIAPLIIAMGGSPRLYVNANFYNSNCYAAFLAAVIVLALGATPNDRRRCAPAAIAIAALLVTLVLSQSRATLALLLAGGVAFALGIGLSLAARWTLPTLAIAVIATAAAMLAKVGFGELWEVGLLGRVAIWVGGLQMIRAHWLFGVGLGRFWDYFEQYRINTYYTRYPHNFLVEVFAELGIVAGSALFVWLVVSTAGAFRQWRRASQLPPLHPDRRLATAVVVAIAILTLHALTDIDWHAPANPILLFALLGIGQHLDRFAAPESFASADEPRKRGTP